MKMPPAMEALAAESWMNEREYGMYYTGIIADRRRFVNVRNNTAVIFVDTRDMSREDWLEARRKGIGGSDAAAIMGANPYVTPLTVYADKIGAAPEKETSEAMRQGTDLEAYVADRFTEATEIKLRRVNRILQHPEYPWMLANIDRDVIGGDGGFEAKTTNLLNKHDFENGEVPLNYMWQCQHYMAVTGAPYWYLAVLVLGKAFHVFRIDRDDALIDRLIQAEQEFWLEHVEKRVPPLPTGSDSDDAALEAIYPESQVGTDADLTELNDTLNLIELLKADKAKLDTRIRSAEEEIKAILCDRERGTAAGWSVSWKSSTRSAVDTKRLRAELPEIAEQYTNTTRTRVFRVNKIKEAG